MHWAQLNKEDHMNNEENVPEVLRSTYRLLKNTFPQALTSPDYLPTLVLLGQGIEQRGLAEVISLFTGQEPAIVLNDVYRACMPGNIAEADIATVRHKLEQHGYHAWLTEDDFSDVTS